MNDLSKDFAISGTEWSDRGSLPVPRRLRVLVIDEEMPFPPDAGKRIRTWNLLRRLARRHSVTLLCYGQENDPAKAALESANIKVCLADPPPSGSGMALYAKLAANLFSYYPYSVVKHYSSAFQNAYATLLRQSDWDLIHCEWTPYARFVSPKTSVPVLIATHNVEAQIWERRAQHASNPLAKSFFALQARKMRRFEIDALRYADAVTAVSEPDADTIRKWGVASVHIVPNGVDIESYESVSEVEQKDDLLSISSLDWFPNADALEYFATQIMPLVRKQHPSAVLRIVGRRPPDSLRNKLTILDGIDFVGEVPDVRPYLKRASVVVVPLRIGGGSRLKILEALAAGKAVVSTSVGAEGLDLVPSQEICIADGPAEFARTVVALLTSSNDRRRIGLAGRARVEKEYGWEQISQHLESVWLRTAKKQTAYEVPSAHQESLRVPV